MNVNKSAILIEFREKGEGGKNFGSGDSMEGFEGGGG